MDDIKAYRQQGHSTAPRLQVLGAVALKDQNSDTLNLGTRKSLWVLACIASQPGPWRREQLSAMFWGDRQEEQARASLRKSLSEIRKALGSDCLSTTNQDVTLVGGALTSDLDDLRGLTALGATNDYGPLATYFTGDFLADVDMSDASGWVEQMRAEARSLATVATKNSIEYLSNKKQFAKAIERARDLMSMDPFSEANHRRLMRLYVCDGEVSKAAAQYRECQRLLHAELGVEPSSETQDLARQILSERERKNTPNSDSPVDLGLAHPPKSAGEPQEFDVPDIPSIAVLPFDNLSGDPEQEYLADGMTEDIIAKVARLRWLFVIARNSTFVYKHQPVDVKRIGKDLGVQYVLEGSTRRVGRRVRITAQLVETNSGNHVWAQQFDRDFGDVFDVQDEVTDRICASLSVELSQSEQRLSRRKPASDHTAWDHYQCGMWHLHKYGQNNLETAQSFFSRAIEKSPAFARAHAGMAHAISAEVIMGAIKSPTERLTSSLQYAQKAVELDDREDRGFTALGLVQGLLGNGGAAIAALERSVDINPCSARAQSSLGWALAWYGQAEAAIAPLDRAFRLSPFDPLLWTFFLYRSSAHFFLGDYLQSLKDAQRASHLKSDEFWPYLAQAVSLQALGLGEEAKAACKNARSSNPQLNVSRVKELVGTMHSDYAERWFKAIQQAGLPDE